MAVRWHQFRADPGSGRTDRGAYDPPCQLRRRNPRGRHRDRPVRCGTAARADRYPCPPGLRREHRSGRQPGPSPGGPGRRGHGARRASRAAGRRHHHPRSGRPRLPVTRAARPGRPADHRHGRAADHHPRRALPLPGRGRGADHRGRAGGGPRACRARRRCHQDHGQRREHDPRLPPGPGAVPARGAARGGRRGAPARAAGDGARPRRRRDRRRGGRGRRRTGTRLILDRRRRGRPRRADPADRVAADYRRGHRRHGPHARQDAPAGDSRPPSAHRGQHPAALPGRGAGGGRHGRRHCAGQTARRGPVRACHAAPAGIRPGRGAARDHRRRGQRVRAGAPQGAYRPRVRRRHPRRRRRPDRRSGRAAPHPGGLRPRNRRSASPAAVCPGRGALGLIPRSRGAPGSAARTGPAWSRPRR